MSHSLVCSPHQHRHDHRHSRGIWPPWAPDGLLVLMARGDGDDGSRGVDSAHAGMIFFAAVDRGHPWLGEAWWRAALTALRWAMLGYAGLGCWQCCSLQQAGVASVFASGLAPPTPEQVAFRARRAVSERQERWAVCLPACLCGWVCACTCVCMCVCACACACASWGAGKAFGWGSSQMNMELELHRRMMRLRTSQQPLRRRRYTEAMHGTSKAQSRLLAA